MRRHYGLILIHNRNLWPRGHAEHCKLVTNNLNTLQDVRLAIKRENCNIATHNIEWLGYKFDAKETPPSSTKLTQFAT